MVEYRAAVEIDAPPEVVFEFLVTDAGMTAWMGQRASLEPVPGGAFAVDIAGYRARGSFLVAAPRRHAAARRPPCPPPPPGPADPSLRWTPLGASPSPGGSRRA